MKFNKIIRILGLFVIAYSIPSFIVSASKSENNSNQNHLLRLSRENYSRLTEIELAPFWTLDYGADLWLEVSNSDFNKIVQTTISYQEGSYKLSLGGSDFDPLLETPNIPENWQTVDNSKSDFYLIQFFAPTRDEWLQTLDSDGIEIVQYIYPFTYLVWSDLHQMQQTTSRDFIRWSGDFHPFYKVLPKWQSLGDILYSTSILLYRGADVDTAIKEIQVLSAEFTGRRILNDTWEIAKFILPGNMIREAARIQGVYSIQLDKTDGGLRGEMSDQINVNNYDENNQAYPGYLPWLEAAGVDGSGVIIANVDGGIYNNHQDLINRLIPCVGQTCGGSASSDHGTHTAGIMAADGSSGEVDIYGFLRGLGMAPGANLVEQVYSPWYSQPGGMLLLMTESFNNGASLSGNSWGPAGTPQGYDDDTLQVDIGVRDADPNAPGNQPFSYILSIMNGGGGFQTQGTPDEAKNIFTIGSTKMQTDGGQQILEIDDLSSNTAHGPALDGRNIPHMVAPGCSVDSTRYPGPYGMMCGTSMASPHVSGAVGLFIEYYRNIFDIDPSPALIKASFLPVAHDLAGHLDADGNVLGHPFDYKQGWGRMDTAAVISPTVDVVYYDNPTIFDNTGETWIQSFSAVDPTKPVRMMLVWTDAPGHGLGGPLPAWNNDLDLVVSVGEDFYYGNYFGSEGWSQVDGTPDIKNNTEGVFLGPTPPESFVIEVVAANINSDGVPNSGDDTDQDFALACYNCTSGADFLIGVQPEDQSICTPEDAVYDLALETVGPFSSTVTLSALGVPEGALLEISSNPVVPPATAVLTVGNTISATAGSYSIDILAIGITRTHTVTAGLDIYDSLPGEFELVAPADRAKDVEILPTLEWTGADQGSNYTLEIARDHNFEDVVLLANDLMSTTYTLGEVLEENQLFFWRVIAHNVCGYYESDIRSFSTFTPVGSCPVGTTSQIGFTEDFEGGAAGWIHGGVADTWSLVNSGGDKNYFADDLPYISDQWLVSPQFDLPAEHNRAELSFWNYQFIQDSISGCVDGALLEVSSDGGNSWNAIEEDNLITDPYDGIASGYGNPIQGMEAWCGDPQNWLESVIRLDEYLGEQVQLRFRLGTDNNIGHDGWGLDDLQLQTCKPTTLLERQSLVSGLPESTVVHRFTLENLSSTETYELSVSGSVWETSLLSGTPITVTGGVSTTVEVAVQIPELAIETEHGMDTFTLTVIAENMPVLELTGRGTTVSETHPDVELMPIDQNAITYPGGEVHYSFTLTNLGDFTDTFNLEATGDWSLELPGGNSSGVLKSGEITFLELIVNAPTDSPGGTSGIATLIATSTLDNAVSISATVTTSLWYQNYLPVVRK